MPKSLKIIIILYSSVILSGIFFINNVNAADTCDSLNGSCITPTDGTCKSVTGRDDLKSSQSFSDCQAPNTCCYESASTTPTTVPDNFKTGVNVAPLKQLGDATLPVLIGRVVKSILGITGAIALLVVVYGAITLLISRGGEGVKKGKDILIWAAIGSMVVLGSYVLVNYAITGLKGGGSTGGAGGASGGQANALSCAGNGGECLAACADDTLALPEFDKGCGDNKKCCITCKSYPGECKSDCVNGEVEQPLPGCTNSQLCCVKLPEQ